jgi:cell division protein FtsI (penicillin-binding protein 3)
MNSRSAMVNERFAARGAIYSATPVLTWRATQWRSKFILAVMMTGFLAIIVRSFILQHVDAEQWQSRAEKRFERVREVPAARGRVLDRHGAVIAASIREEALGIVPRQFKLSSARVDDLANIIGMRPAELRSRISKATGFFYLTRGLNLEQADKIRALRLTGVELEVEYRRHYPYGDTFAHVVGFTNADDHGAEGLERILDSDLRGITGVSRVFVDRRNEAFGERVVKPPAQGQDLQLSLDAGIQTIVQAALKEAMQAHRPRAASAVVVDTQTGEVLAMASEPTFDPNNRTRLNADTVRNRSVTDTFEPGSTLKPFSIAAAIELGRVTPATVIDTGTSGRLAVGNRTIGDTKSHGVLTVEAVLQKSSNIGTVKVAQTLKPQELHDFYYASGFGRMPEGGFAGATAGRLRNPQRWVPIDHATISYGHGVSVSLLQLARAYTMIARDGQYLPLSFVRQSEPPQGQQVMSVQTARAIKKMLQMATEPGGTGPLAQIPGFKVAGKTGTAHKPEKGGYAKDKYVVSFAGFAPADRPRFVVAVMVDEPSAGKYLAGEVAAPVFAQVADNTLRRLQLSPNPALRVLPAGALLAEGSM